MSESERVYNVGLIGLGKMGVLHAVIINALPGARIRALCDSQRLLTSLASKALPTVSFYSQHREMLMKEDLDAVFVTTPTHTHGSIVADILRVKPVHIFVEKPLAANAEEAYALVELLHRLNVIGMVGYQKRFSNTFAAGLRVLDANGIGDIIFYRGSTFSSDVLRSVRGWRFAKDSGGGAIKELGAHLLDLLLWYFGEPTHVEAATRSPYSKRADDYAHAVFLHRKGVVGHVDVSWSVRGFRLPETTIEVHGTEGKMVVTDDYIRLQTEKPVQAVLPDRVLAPGQHVFYQQSFPSVGHYLYGEAEYGVQDSRFFEALTSSLPSEPSFRTAAMVDHLLDQIYEKAEGWQSKV